MTIGASNLEVINWNICQKHLKLAPWRLLGTFSSSCLASPWSRARPRQRLSTTWWRAKASDTWSRQKARPKREKVLKKFLLQTFLGLDSTSDTRDAKSNTNSRDTFLAKNISTKKWPKNDPKLPKLAQKWQKIAKMAQKWPKMAQKLAPTEKK